MPAQSLDMDTLKRVPTAPDDQFCLQPMNQMFNQKENMVLW